MKRFVIAVLKRLLLSAAIVISTAAFGFVYAHFSGPSRIAYSALIVTIAWPWTFPQIFVLVCVLWFLVEGIRRLRIVAK